MQQNLMDGIMCGIALSVGAITACGRGRGHSQSFVAFNKNDKLFFCDSSWTVLTIFVRRERFRFTVKQNEIVLRM